MPSPKPKEGANCIIKDDRLESRLTAEPRSIVDKDVAKEINIIINSRVERASQ